MSSVSDYEYRQHYVGDRSVVRVPRDVIRAPTPPPLVQRVVERAPTPEPDIVERVIVRPQPQQLIERIIERPRTPPPKVIEKEINEPAPPPIVRTRVVKVDPTPRHYISPVNTRVEYRQTPTYGYADYADNYHDRSYSTYTTVENVQGYPSVFNYTQPSMAQANVAPVSYAAQQVSYPYGYQYGYQSYRAPGQPY